LLENEQRANVKTTSSMGSSAGAKVCAWAKAEMIWVRFMVVEGKRGMETPVNKTRILISAICLASRAPHGPGIERTRRREPWHQLRV
jgi:hypothetical protein